MQKYYLYIDECGDHNLKNYDPVFPIFTLCGILVTQENRKSLVKAFENLKKDFFGTTDIVIHSVDIRKWRGSFSILEEDDVRQRFFAEIEDILKQNGAYVIVSCTILKEQLKKFCTVVRKMIYMVCPCHICWNGVSSMLTIRMKKILKYRLLLRRGERKKTRIF